VNDELERIWKEMFKAYLKYFAEFAWRYQRKPQKNLSGQWVS
jgi:hypothetical protein